jgi:hypothetical protein
MRVYWKQPEQEVRIVRPDNEGDDYEIWVLTPVCVGSVQRAGTSRILADGVPHSNLNAAARFLLEKANFSGLAKGMWMRSGSARTDPVIKLTGLDLVERNAWPTFCKHRKINARSVSDMNKTYELTKAELTKLGLAE